MGATATNRLTDVRNGQGKALNIALWCVQVLLALVFVGAASGKLMGKPDMIALFNAIGIGQWFRYVTGILELTGAVLIVLPKTRSLGAALLAIIMLGAVTAHLFILHVSPAAPATLLLLSSLVVFGRRQELAQFGRALTGADSQ